MVLSTFMKLKFPYGSSYYIPGFGHLLSINVLLLVETIEGFAPFSFVFDTGADITSFPTSAAKKLGIDLDKCPKESMTGYAGTTVFVYRSNIKIRFNKKIFGIPCVLNPNEDVPILLGRAGIVDKFNVLLDGKNKQIIFEEL